MRGYPIISSLMLCSAMSIAHAGEVTFKLSGVGFEGGPAFEAAIGGQVIATGTVEEPKPDGEDFSFSVPDELLNGTGDLTLRLTNDYFAGEGQDRSLLVLGATIGNQELTPDRFIVAKDGQKVERDSSTGVPLWSGDETAVAIAPADGWLGTGAPAETVVPACSGYAEVVGMASGSMNLSEIPLDALGPIVDVANAGACSVTITGYADKSGSEIGNLRITAARASAVLDALLAAGARFQSANIVPTTGTDQFGPAPSDNRRVTVQLWDPSPQPVAEPRTEAEDPISQLALEVGQANLAHLLALGWRSTGELYLRSSNTDPKEVLWLIEQAKARLIAGDPVLGPGQ